MKEMFIEIPINVLEEVLEILKEYSNLPKEKQEKLIKELEKVVLFKKMILED